MHQNQSDLFAAGLLRMPPPAPQLPKPSDCLLKSVAVHEFAFGLCVALSTLRNIAGDSFAEVLCALRELCEYQIRQAQNRGTAYRTIALHLDHVETRLVDGVSVELLTLPRGSRGRLIATLARFGITPDFHPISLPSRAALEWIGAPFADGSRLDDLQQDVLQRALAASDGRIVDFGMAGGKSLLIAGALRAHADLRPAVVTGNNANDSAQLALTLARSLKERVCLIGCTGSIPTAVRRAELVHERDWKTASIIVGTHAALHRVEPAAIRADDGVARRTFDHSADDEVLASAPLVIADEVDTLPTLTTTHHLLGMRPQKFYGFTGTWGRRTDRMEAVLLDIISADGPAQSVIHAGHQAVVGTGRVTNMALHAYEFSETDYPVQTIPPNQQFRPSLVLTNIVRHDGRNRFCAELVKHVHGIATSEGGTVLVFVKTIEHSFEVLRHLCPLLDLPFNEEDLRNAGVIVHNAQLPTIRKVGNLRALKAGSLRLVITTDTLAVGFDCARISDAVDLTGMQESRRSLQRAGRALRRADGKFIARYHYVSDTHHPALAMISRRKREAIEAYFNRSSIVHSAGRLPWRTDAISGLSPGLILQELKNTNSP